MIFHHSLSDDDDFDPTSNIDKSKVIDLGLEKTINKKDEIANEKEKEKKNAQREAELEALEAAKESDLIAGMALIGLSGVKEKTLEQRYEGLKSKKQFEDFAFEQAQIFKTRSKDPQFTAFALVLIKELCADSKFLRVTSFI